MSEQLVGVVVAHSELAAALLTAVRAIAGDDHGLTAVSNTGCDRAALTRGLEAAIGGRPAVVFTDMAGGSCAFTAAALARGHGEVKVVTGVNLAMLLDFAFHRELPVAEAAQRAVEVGRTAVGLVQK